MIEPTPIDTPAAQPAPAPGEPIYTSTELRSITVQLKHPFTVDGQEVSEVTVRRLRGFEAKSYAQACTIAAEQGKQEPKFPGVLISDKTFELLDDDDVFQIDQAVEAFLPARFRAMRAVADKLAFQAYGKSSNGGP